MRVRSRSRAATPMHFKEVHTRRFAKAPSGRNKLVCAAAPCCLGSAVLLNAHRITAQGRRYVMRVAPSPTANHPRRYVGDEELPEYARRTVAGKVLHRSVGHNRTDPKLDHISQPSLRYPAEQSG